jgi:hypothetical protein
MKKLTDEELLEFLMRPTVNGLITAHPIKWDIHTFTTIPAKCSTCEKVLGYIITKTETYFECTSCYEAEVG